MSVERCEGCGYVWAEVGTDEVSTRVIEETSRLGHLFRQVDDGAARRRSEPSTWSMIEYGAHLRDVLLVQRDRLVLGVVEDSPSFAPMYCEHRVDLGLYATDSPASLGEELQVAARLFTRLFDQLDATQLQRPVIYNYPEPTTRTVLWLGQQTLHEVEHHGGDIDATVASP